MHSYPGRAPSSVDVSEVQPDWGPSSPYHSDLRYSSFVLFHSPFILITLTTQLILFLYLPPRYIMSDQGSVNSWGQPKGDPNQIQSDTPITIHPNYSDPEGSTDMVIQTEDNVQFKVHSYYLKAAR
jgi:hypothetical protein